MTYTVCTCQVILESAADLLQISSPGQLLRVGVSPEGRVRLNANGQTVTHFAILLKMSSYLKTLRSDIMHSLIII